MLPDRFLMTAVYGGTSVEAELDSNPGGEEAAPDPFLKFIENAQLEAALGRNGHQHVERFAEEIQNLDARARQIPTAQKAAGWDEEIRSAGGRLEKRAAPTGGRVQKSANGQWLLTYDERGELISGRAIE